MIHHEFSPAAQPSARYFVKGKKGTSITMNMSPKPNHLAGQTSPYLLQHLYNPVDWYPWGEEALEKAEREDKPILISIGYSACHWCHVMENESFEDPVVAEVMNSNFICIKVDREERPDIDHLYMTAVQLLTRQGGWPLNCFALPDSRPFWGGTYFPREHWKNVLTQVADLYKNRREELVEQAESLIKGVTESSFIKPGGHDISFQQSDAEKFFRNIMKHMDRVEGGTLHAPKFPLPVNLEFLLHYHHKTGDIPALEQAELSLEKMAMGGIYDQVGGGFARYSTDEIWKVPHFEKMLYDNGQLVSIYSNAWKISKKSLYRDVVYKTVEFLDRELTSPEGTFYSALDADSEGDEGKFYIWQENEIDQVLGPDSDIVKEYYQVGKKGLWENGASILLRNESDEEFSKKRDISADTLQAIIHSANKRLLAARSARIRPGLDNKVLTSWNALMIKGLADAYAAFQDQSFLLRAKKAADFIISHSMTPSGKIHRSLNGNKPSIDGFLEDYTLFAQALIRLYEVSAEPGYLFKAKELTEYVLENFSSSNTRLFSFSSLHSENLKADYFDIHDNVIPSSNGILAANLLYLANYFEKYEWASYSTLMLSDISQQMLDHSINFAAWGRILLFNLYPFYTMVICGPGAGSGLMEINSLYNPGVIVAGSTGEDNEIPVFRDRCREGKTLYYPCSMGNCKMPAEDPGAALEQVR
jgi:uncharacterized protein